MNMNKNFILIAVALVFATTQLSATPTLTLIHYWNFNSISIPLKEQSFSSSSNDNTNPKLTLDRALPANALTPIAADASLSTPAATLIYQVKPGTVGTVYSGWDPAGVSTGTSNQRGTDISGNALRPRDAWQNMELVLNMPSTGYQNLTIKYDSQRSGSGPTVNTYYYSVDGGTNWIITGLSTLTNPVVIPSTGFALQTITITDVNADNNANLKFKIWYSDPTNLAGNNRIDNITVEGTAVGGTTAIEEAQLNKEITMTPSTNKTGVVTFSEVVNAVVFNVQGKQVKAVAKTTNLVTSDLAKGLYIVRINGSVSKKLIIE